MIVVRFVGAWFVLSVVAGVVAGKLIAGPHPAESSPYSPRRPAADPPPAPPAPVAGPAPAPSHLQSRIRRDAAGYARRCEIARLESMFAHPAYRSDDCPPHGIPRPEQP